MLRDIITIDEELCDGCGDCVPNCHEGALQIIDGKARLVSELMCDGLGACLGHCHTGALFIEKKDVPEYDEIAVIKAMIPQGYNTIIAHLKHLKDHDEKTFVKQAIGYLRTVEEDLPFSVGDIMDELHGKTPAPQFAQMKMAGNHGGGCPGSRPQQFEVKPENLSVAQPQASELTQWPVQMHLINPAMSAFAGADLMVAADCVAFSLGDFHQKWLKGKKLAIACPKLDDGQQIYYDKLLALIDDAKVNTITVMIMEVPCCGGLQALVKKAAADANRKVPVKAVVVGVRGDIISEQWL